MADSVLAPVRPIFRSLAVTIVPDAAALDERAWGEVEQHIEEALRQRVPRMRRQLRLLVRALDVLPVTRYGRPFTKLDPARRTRVLERVERSRVLLLRRGFWGLRTLVMLGYYGRPEAARAIGYRASPLGWEARR